MWSKVTANSELLLARVPARIWVSTGKQPTLWDSIRLLTNLGRHSWVKGTKRGGNPQLLPAVYKSNSLRVIVSILSAPPVILVKLSEPKWMSLWQIGAKTKRKTQEAVKEGLAPMVRTITYRLLECPPPQAHVCISCQELPSYSSLVEG